MIPAAGDIPGHYRGPLGMIFKDFPVDLEAGMIGAERLAEVARAAFGRRRLDGVTRLRGGSKKGVYRAAFGDGGTAIFYIWDPTEDYWPGQADGADAGPGAPFAHSSGLELFLTARARLAGLGVRTPGLFLADGSRARFESDVAVLEDVPGPTLEALIEQHPDRAAPVLERLAEAVGVMHGQQGATFGRVGYVDAGGVAAGGNCEAIVLDRALADLAEGAARDGRLAAIRDDLQERLHGLAAAIHPRFDHRLIHGELGPDHVLVDARGRPVMIDIEGL